MRGIFAFGILLVGCHIFCSSVAQNAIKFEYRTVPTSTTEYTITVNQDSITLLGRELKTGQNSEIRKNHYFNYARKLSNEESSVLDTIIKNNKLDSVGLYNSRLTEWGKLWKVTIIRDSKVHYIDLPNYHNQGLESLLIFIRSLIPNDVTRKLPFFEM